MAPFENRASAGAQLGARLLELEYEDDHPAVVFALVRGGVAVGVQAARALAAPLELLLVRKLGARPNRELAVGAIAEGGVAVLDESLAEQTGTSRAELEALLADERAKLAAQVARLRSGRAPAIDPRGRTAIVVDDGMATGLSTLAAVIAMREREAARVVVAVPVASREAVALLESEADAVLCLVVPPELQGVGRWYEDFEQVTEEQVLALLDAYEPPPA